MQNSVKKGVVAVGATSLMASSAYALTSTFNISVAFSQPFTIVEAQKLTFGTLISGTTANYTIDTADTVTATGAGAVIGGTPKSGNYTITDTGTAASNVDISIGTLTANNGVTPSNPTCDWNGQGAVAGCALSDVTDAGGGHPLLVGMTLAVSGAQANGSTAAPTFKITVIYH